LAPPARKNLHPGFRPEVAQALLALGLSLEFEVADAQLDLIIPMYIEQHAAIVKELVKVAWPGSEDTADKFGDRVKMWESLNAFNLRAIQLFAVEAIATKGRVPKADVTTHMKTCLDTLMRKHDFDIDARRRELLADRNTTDVVEALMVFLGDRYVPNAAELYKILCEDKTTYEGLLSMGLRVKTTDVQMQANFFSIALSTLIKAGLITEDHCRMKTAATAKKWQDNVDGKTRFLMTVVEAVHMFHSGTPAQIFAAAPSMGKDRKLQGMKIPEGDIAKVIMDPDIRQALRLADNSEDPERILELLYKDFPTSVVKVHFLDALHDCMRNSSTSTTTTTSSSPIDDKLTEDLIAVIAAGKETTGHQHRAKFKALVTTIAAAIGAGLVGFLPRLPSGAMLVRPHHHRCP
jgi:hypothetical protein